MNFYIEKAIQDGAPRVRLGVVMIDDPVWRAPGILGEAGAVFSADRLSANVDLAAALAGAQSDTYHAAPATSVAIIAARARRRS